MRGIWVVLAIVFGAAACSKSGGANGPGGVADGKERGACYGNGTCDQGLVCYSALCVRPPGADCTKVAEKLSGYRLDNYAPRDERAKVVAELAALCTKEQLTEDEGRCILDSHGRGEIGRCPRPLLPELVADPTGCKNLGDHFADMLFAELAGDGANRAALEAYRVELVRAMDASCAEDGWTDAARDCVLGAATMDAMERCEAVIPEGMQDKVRARLGPLVERLRDLRGGGGAATPTPPATVAPSSP